MSQFAALVVRSHGGWKGADTDDFDVSACDDIEDVADLMRDAVVDDGTALLFVEEDDEWFGIVRVDGSGEPTAFISDARVIGTSELAGRLFADLTAEDDAEEDFGEESDGGEETSVKPAIEPRGAADVLADFGISGPALLEMCAEEGALPADVITAIGERLGCADEFEVYR